MVVAVGGVWRRAGACNVQQFHADVGASSNSMLSIISEEEEGWASSPKRKRALQGIGVIVRVEVVGLSARPDFSTWSG